MMWRLLVLLWAGIAAWAADGSRPNFLVIAVDDLRDELGCYGASHIRSPNIDSLASQGVVFDRAFCQQAVCGPSRNSVFSGARPDKTRVWNNSHHFREALPGIASLPEFFKNYGYYTRGYGKILHNRQDDPISWSSPFFYPEAGQYAAPGREGWWAGIDGIHAFNRERPLFEAADVPDNAYRDGVICDEAVMGLRQAAQRARPFFIMVGFHKPHTPFNAPKRYWDLYSREDIRLAPNPFPPEGAPSFALYNWGYVRSFQGMPESGPMPDALAREVKHAYFACISYIDAQVGRLLAALRELNLAEETVVALWSDHGYQLGEHGMWSKHTNFETSTKVPLLIVDPRGGAQGERSGARVELIDLYPTLAELAGLPLPGHLDGQSRAALLHHPQALDGRDTAAYSQFLRAGKKGLSVRTGRFRYTEWRDVETGEVDARELYDHDEDPGENQNRAGDVEYVPEVRALAARLEEVWPRP